MEALIRSSRVGSTDVYVSPLGIGGGSLFNAIGDTSFREVVDEAWSIGLRYFDTAPLYADGLSEHRFGAALEGRPRHEYVLSTKTGRWKEGDGNRYDYSYFGTMQSIEESMRRLKTTYIDIVFIHDLIRALHGEQFEERFEEAMSGAYRALTDLKRLGKVKAIGAALREPDVCERFARSGQFDCFMLAGGHTLLQHAAMSSLLPLCIEKKISVLVASPFNTGILATGAKADARYEYRPAKDTPGIVERVQKLEEIGLEFDVPLPSAALQYPLRHPAVVSVVAGHQSTGEVRENIALLTRAIPDDYWQALGNSGLIPKSAVIPFR